MTTNIVEKKRYSTVPEAIRFWAKVDKTSSPNGCWLWTASLDSGGYGAFRAAGGRVRAHRFSWEQANGPIPEGLVLDHIDCVRHCVLPTHLRAVTQQINAENRKGANSNNISGRLNVYYHIASGKWRVSVRHKGVSYHFGYFTDIEVADKVAKRERKALHDGTSEALL